MLLIPSRLDSNHAHGWLAQLMYFHATFAHRSIWATCLGPVAVLSCVLVWRHILVGAIGATHNDALANLLLMPCLAILLYKTEAESRRIFALKRVMNQKAQHHRTEMGALRQEAQLIHELQSGFSQLHHVLKNILVGVQV